jgi:hypothetical protein
MELKYPNMRNVLKEHLQLLSDTKVAPGREPVAGDQRWKIYNDVGYAMSFLLDDLDVTKDDAASCIGILIYDETEAVTVARTSRDLLNYLETTTNPSTTDADVERAWAKVNNSAIQALSVVTLKT